MTIIADTGQGEPVATFQGASVIAWRAARTPGWESDAYEVTLPAVGFRSLSFDVPADELYPDLGRDAGAASVAVSGARPAMPLSGVVKIRGDLIASDGRGAPLPFRDLYVRDDGIEVSESGDDENGRCTVRLSLVDIRYFWAHRGELWGTYNVRLADGLWQPGTVKAGDNGQGAGGSTSLREGRDVDAYSLKEILEKIAQALPGRPRIAQMTGAAAGIRPVDLVWRGIRPKDEAERLCRLYGVTFTLTLDNRLSFSDSAEPDPRPLDAAPGAARTVGGGRLIEGSWRRRLRRTFRHVPDTVRVVGAPVVREVRVDRLEHVGYRRDAQSKKIDRRRLVTADEAAQSYGLTLAEVGAYVLQPQHIRVRYLEGRGLEDPKLAASEIDEWAFRLFRLPLHALGFLPILPERAESMIYEARRQDEAAGGAGAAQEAIGDPIRRIPPLVEADSFEEHRDPPEEEETASTDEAQEAADDAAGAAPRFTAQDAPGAAFATLRDLAKVARREFKTRFENVEWAPRDDARVDGRRGTVHFGRPVGHLVGPDGANPTGLKSADLGSLKSTVRARITFAYNDSATAADALKRTAELQGGDGITPSARLTATGGARGAGEARYNFTALYGRAAQGAKPELLNERLLEPGADKRGFPLVVREDALRLFVSLADVTNEGPLLRRAEEIAKPFLFAARERWGEEGEAGMLAAILPSSKISRVEWFMGPDGLGTKWSIENVAAAKRNQAAKLAGLADVDLRDRRAIDRVIRSEP